MEKHTLIPQIEKQISSSLENIAKLRETKDALRNIAEMKYDWKSTALQLDETFKTTIKNFEQIEESK